MTKLLVAGLLLGATCLASPATAKREILIESGGLPTAGSIILPVANAAALDAAARQVDTATGGGLTRAIASSRFSGEAGKVLTLHGLGAFNRIILLGTGSAALDRTALEDLGARAAKAMGDGLDGATLLASGLKTSAPAPEALIGLGAALASYTAPTYASGKKAQAMPGSLTIRSDSAEAARKAFESDWKHLADAVGFVRDLKTEPANVLYPQSFVDRTQAAFRGVKNVTIDVLDEKKLAEIKAGAILAVGQGSARPPRLLVVRYAGGKPGDAPFAFVGKGITFDSGGISLKPGDGMWEMKQDMAGAAASVGTVLALARRGAPVNAVAVAALAENMPDGNAIRPGDVITTLSGKSIEVLNTDAEGRLVLADAVWFAERQFRPRLMVDVATLTGAITTALGDEYAGLFTRSDTLSAQLLSAGEAANERLWRLPLHTNHERDIETPIADVKNISGGKRAGASVGAAFIGSFVSPQANWAHLDIAGVDLRDNEDLPTVPKGASGFGVRLLDTLVRQLSEAR